MVRKSDRRLSLMVWLNSEVKTPTLHAACCGDAIHIFLRPGIALLFATFVVEMILQLRLAALEMGIDMMCT